MPKEFLSISERVTKWVPPGEEEQPSFRQFLAAAWR